MARPRRNTGQVWRLGVLGVICCGYYVNKVKVCFLGIGVGRGVDCAWTFGKNGPKPKVKVGDISGVNEAILMLFFLKCAPRGRLSSHARLIQMN